MGDKSTSAVRRAFRGFTTALALVLLAALLMAGTALAAGHEAGGSAAKPGKPTAVAPIGVISDVTPTFSWTKAQRATKYEVRVYEGTDLLFTRAGIRTLSWTSRVALPANVDLTWKVRGIAGRIAGPWSAATAFSVVPSSPAKAITAFGFHGLVPPVAGTVNEAAHAIAATVPSGTKVTALVATFVTTGASVTITGTPQVSGVTANNFTNPVTYVVTAADGTTQAYVVTVTVAAAAVAVGDLSQGGVVAYIYGPGDVGYVAGQQHGLVAARQDLAGGAWLTWSNVGDAMVGTSGAAGTGAANTVAIVAQPGCTSGAAYLCANLVEGGYSDWYMPSSGELSLMYVNRAAIGGFASIYWSSTEFSAAAADTRFFTDGTTGWAPKTAAGCRARAVRSF